MDMTVSETILKQLGGSGRLKCMVGANNFLTISGQEVSFRFKMCKKINYVKIVLNGKDLYDVYFGKVKKFDYEEVKEYHDVYCDQLVELFEKTTGLYLSL